MHGQNPQVDTPATAPASNPSADQESGLIVHYRTWINTDEQCPGGVWDGFDNPRPRGFTRCSLRVVCCFRTQGSISDLATGMSTPVMFADLPPVAFTLSDDDLLQTTFGQSMAHDAFRKALDVFRGNAAAMGGLLAQAEGMAA